MVDRCIFHSRRSLLLWSSLLGIRKKTPDRLIPLIKLNWIFAKCVFFLSTIVCHLLRPAQKPQMKTEKPSGRKTDERQTDDRMLGKIHCCFFRSFLLPVSPAVLRKGKNKKDTAMKRWFHQHRLSFTHTHTAPVCYIFAVVPWSLRRRLFARLLSFFFSFFPNSSLSAPEDLDRTGHLALSAVVSPFLFCVCVTFCLPLGDAPSRLCSPLQTLLVRDAATLYSFALYAR